MSEIKNIDELTYLKGVGPKRAEILLMEGISSIQDLIYYFPRTYINRKSSSSIRDLHSQLKNQIFEIEMNAEKVIPEKLLRSEVSIIGDVKEKTLRKFGKNKTILSITVSDKSNAKAFLTFFNRAEYFSKTYNEGDKLLISGKPEIDNFGLKFVHPEIEIFDEEEIQSFEDNKILPQYRVSELMNKVGLTSRLIHNIVKPLLERYLKNSEETLNQETIEKFGFLGIQETIQNLHFPTNDELLEKAKNRLKFEELFYYQLNLLITKKSLTKIEKGVMFGKKSHSARLVYENLPFELTKDQKKVLNEIAADTKSGKSMNRLLQGDVGSGKTIVSIFAALMALDNGYQVVMMAPTEILAEQHFKNFQNFTANTNYQLEMLTGSLTKKQKNVVVERIMTAEPMVIIGTHALFQEKITYGKLGLILIDEQHRFGVLQRAELKKLAQDTLPNDESPHILVMTATPIPRTLTMSVFGDLDLSIIKTLPSNRIAIKTKVWYESKVDVVYQLIRDEIALGRQAFIVYPLVEVSEKLELKSAVENYELISKQIFPKLKCGLLHGQMSSQEKDEVMDSFKRGEFQILISTTVIEVGIDIPNASIMVIQNAERFGLSQLHQLRGRVGRGSEQSYCILMTKDHFEYQIKDKSKKDFEKKAAIIRLKTMEETNDGFVISEVDLKLRGPGDVLGTKQSGVPDFKYASLIDDVEIMELASNYAKEIISQDPDIEKAENSIIKKTYNKLYKRFSHLGNIA